MVHKVTWSEFVDMASRCVHSKMDGGSSWYDNESPDIVCERLRMGHDKHVETARGMVESLNVQAPETSLGQWQNSVCGAYPCVPEAIAGFGSYGNHRFGS